MNNISEKNKAPAIVCFNIEKNEILFAFDSCCLQNIILLNSFFLE